ncbi:MAG: asparagine synthetase B family protein [Acidobacteriota bacterium]|nr:asparagine synthetase B family protein [Blastocatellia bacterium]MDW8411349.1 asparagine synthetase B family protein [Acidobacteriota bacterium]
MLRFRQPKIESAKQTPQWLVILQDALPTITDGEAVSIDQILLVGDIWLSNRQALLAELNDCPSNATDAEIVARLWQIHAIATPLKLQGMFAFYVYDSSRRQGWLVRDSSGSRTIYYSDKTAGARLRNVASSLSKRTVDLVALRDYLCCAFVPDKRTLLKGICEVRPGTLVEFPQGKEHIYWQIEERVTAQGQLQWHAERLRKLLEQVISEYLPQDEDVGVYLSGGIDSSAVTALAKLLHHKPVHTYSIHFGTETPNELKFSSLVAEHCQTKHTIIEITPQQMWQLLPQTMSILDDPIGDPLTVPNLILGQDAAKTCKVILNGEGGDPCFGGPKNQPMLLRQLYSANHRSEVEDYLTSFQKCSDDLPHLLKPDIYQQVKQESYFFEEDLKIEASYLNKLMFINTKYKGADHILTKVNNITSELGLSGRSPLFDRRVVELSLEIPPEFKLQGAREKAVLKAAVADLLPEAILNRPKSGMMVPVQLGFRKYWNKPARDLLLDKKALIYDYLQPSLIKAWLDYRGDLWSRYGVKLWLIASLEYWLRANL